MAKSRTVTTRFVCKHVTNARKVYIAGDFNGWNPQADRMQKRNGAFVKKMQLLPGEYQYKFVIDGEWHADPAAETQVPNDCGTLNSVVIL